MNSKLPFLKNLSVAGLLLLLLGTGQMPAAEFSGQFNSLNPYESFRLLLEQDDDEVYGELSDGFVTFNLEGAIDDARVSGEAIRNNDDSFGFSVRFLADGNLELQLYPLDIFGNPLSGVASTLLFAATTNTAPTSPDSPAVANGQREIYINRVRLSAAVVATLATQYSIPIQDGRYWYDVTSGAWGQQDGPTAGFILAGIALPGPMPRDISQGGTDIFINGREIHPLDQQALQRLFGQTIAGNYWLDAQGNLGPVGGAPIANLASAMQQSAAQSDSTTHGYGQGGGARGTAGGGMYSGRTASGKSVFWYPGM